MEAAITESNLMVNDSDELSSKIFTTFPSFWESHSQPLGYLERSKTQVMSGKQIIKNITWKGSWRPRPLAFVIFTIVAVDKHAGAGVPPTPTYTDPHHHNIRGSKTPPLSPVL